MPNSNARRRIVVMGAAGRDFHNFNMVYRSDPEVEVVAFTATQIPGIEDRRYPAELAGPLYPRGIPIFDEAHLAGICRAHAVDGERVRRRRQVARELGHHGGGLEVDREAEAHRAHRRREVAVDRVRHAAVPLGRGAVTLEPDAHHVGLGASADTLDLIEKLAPRTVIPGHGPVFHDAPRALGVARKRLDGFVQHPLKHALYAAKVLLKYKLLEWQEISVTDLRAWTDATPYFGAMHERHFSDRSQSEWLEGLMNELVRSGAARREGALLINL